LRSGGYPNLLISCYKNNVFALPAARKNVSSKMAANMRIGGSTKQLMHYQPDTTT
jgi:hypothetical protein